MILTIGSTALKYWWDDWREPSDIDVWIDNEEEIKNLEKGTDYKIIPSKILKLCNKDCKNYATPSTIYTIKCSHLGWDNPMWDKHKRDIIIMKQKGCIINEPLYKALKEFWKTELGNKPFLSLDKSKKEFFTDHVHYVYDHDELHKIISYPNEPMYTYTLKDGADVLTCEVKFSKLCFEDQVRMFREEISVIACERWLLNPYWQKQNISWYEAYILALKKTITTLTKNWANDFIVMNLEHFIKPDYSYFENLLKKENLMSNVDLTIFEKALKNMNATVAIKTGRTNFKDNELPPFIYELCENGFYGEDKNYLIKNHGYRHVEQEGGGEGGSEYCYGVFELDGKFYKAEYSYFSYDGHEYDNIHKTLKEVFPKEKLVTVYE